jgi:FkbM family methyltransferase
MDGAFRAIVGRGHRIGTVIDIGASNGAWSGSLMPFLPASRYLLIEAQAVHDAALRDFCASHAQAEYVLAAAGDGEGTIHFDTSDPLGGLASETAFAANDVVVPMVTVDATVAARRLPGPYLLKFDTHGFELPILRGATATLQETEVVVMECYNFHIAPEAMTFDAMCAHMRTLGFRCIDLVCPLHRPYDDAFWQADLVFVRSDRPEFTHLGYR